MDDGTLKSRRNKRRIVDSSDSEENEDHPSDVEKSTATILEPCGAVDAEPSASSCADAVHSEPLELAGSNGAQDVAGAAPDWLGKTDFNLFAYSKKRGAVLKNSKLIELRQNRINNGIARDDELDDSDDEALGTRLQSVRARLAAPGLLNRVAKPATAINGTSATTSNGVSPMQPKRRLLRIVDSDEDDVIDVAGDVIDVAGDVINVAGSVINVDDDVIEVDGDDGGEAEMDDGSMSSTSGDAVVNGHGCASSKSIRKSSKTKRFKARSCKDNVHALDTILTEGKGIKKMCKRVQDSDDDGDYWEGSDGSDGEGNSSRRRTTPHIERQVVQYFNTVAMSELLTLSWMNQARAELVIKARPFVTLFKMFNSFVRRGLTIGIINKQIEVAECQEQLTALLDRCRLISDKITEAAEEVKAGRSTHAAILAQPEPMSDELTMKNYQLIGLNWLTMMHRHRLNAILADEMGLGKTVQVIAYLTYLKENNLANGTHLVVVPSSCINNWCEEFAKWSPSMNILAYYGNQSDRRSFREAVRREQYGDLDVLLTTYHLVNSTKQDKLFFRNQILVDHAVYDEAHMLKNCLTSRYTALMKIEARYRVLLTGTPLQNNLIELVSLLNFVMPTLFAQFPDLSLVLKMFVNKGGSGAAYEQERIEQAKAIMKPFILRRLKCDVLSDLPKKVETIIHCPMPEAQARLYHQVKTRSLGSYGSSLKSKYMNKAASHIIMELRKAANHPMLLRFEYTDEVLQRMVKEIVKMPEHADADEKLVLEDLDMMTDFELHRFCTQRSLLKRFAQDPEFVCSSAKLVMLDELLPKLKAEKAKILLFSQFTLILDILEPYCQLRGHKYMRMDGSTSVLIRQDMIDQFNSDDEAFIFLLSTKAGGLGINLTSANCIIIHDIDFNPYNDKQAEDRCHRLGQLRDVTVMKLLCENTIDQTIMRYATNKLNLEEQITGKKNEDSDAMQDILSEVLKEDG